MAERALRLLQLYHDCGPGGAEQTIVHLCRWLKGEGHAVAVVTCREGWLADRLRETGIDTRIVPKRRLVDVGTLREILRIAREWRADVLHAHELPMMLGMAPAARLRRFPLVATVQGRAALAAHGRRRLACRIAGRWCRSVVGVSRALSRFLVDDVRVAEAKVQTIYNAIDLRHYEVEGDGRAVREALGLPASAPVVGTVGSLYPVKGQTYLLQALARVAAHVPDVVCLIAGHGALLPVLQQEAAELGLGGRVKFLGFRADVPDLLRAMDVFVLPSLSEGLPLALLEAQAAGKPAVASEVGGIPEVVETGFTGYLVPPGRADLLADRILHLLRDPAHARALGARGRARVQRSFSVETMGREYLTLYRRCANGAMGPRAAWAV